MLTFIEEFSKYLFLVPTLIFVAILVDRIRAKKGVLDGVVFAGSYFWALLVFDLMVQTVLSALAYALPALLRSEGGFVAMIAVSLAVYVAAAAYYALSFRNTEVAGQAVYPKWLRLAFAILTVSYLVLQLVFFFFPRY